MKRPVSDHFYWLFDTLLLRGQLFFFSLPFTSPNRAPWKVKNWRRFKISGDFIFGWRECQMECIIINLNSWVNVHRNATPKPSIFFIVIKPSPTAWVRAPYCLIRMLKKIWAKKSVSHFANNNFSMHCKQCIMVFATCRLHCNLFHRVNFLLQQQQLHCCSIGLSCECQWPASVLMIVSLFRLRRRSCRTIFYMFIVHSTKVPQFQLEFI